MKVLFITWDGPQTNYLEGLFIPIFVGLKSKGMDVEIIQFTWATDDRIEITRNKCREHSIPYTVQRIIHKPKVLGALVSVLIGIFFARKYLQSHKVNVLLTRSILPSLISIWASRRMPNINLVFDGDGLPYDERVDFSGLNPSGLVYRLMRDEESQITRVSKSVITRSAISADILHARAGANTKRSKFYVANNGRDTDQFTPMNLEHGRKVRFQLDWPEDCPMLVYAGSLGAQYCESQMIKFFKMVSEQNENTRWLILSGDAKRSEALKNSCGTLSTNVVTMQVDSERIPYYLSAADLGMALRKPSFSMKAVSPIKLGEYLLCGVPVIATGGIGDTESMLDESIGFLADTESSHSLLSAAKWFNHKVLPSRATYRSACRERGLKYFSLDATVETYEAAIQHALTE